LKYLNTQDRWIQDGYNHFIYINTPNERTVWQVFSWYETTVDFNYINTYFSDDEDYVEFLLTIQGKNMIEGLEKMGFSPAATILLMSAAAALGDAGSPASDTTLGPTSGLNADGQHDHIWDTCVPTFIHFNIPIMVVSVIAAQFI
jgi:hypothetical protein